MNLNDHLPHTPPRDALFLVSGTLTAPPNFLLQHFAVNTLKQERPVLFWSFINDFAFYKSSCRKWGCNLQSFMHSRKLTFVDGSAQMLSKTPCSRYGSDKNSLCKYLLFLISTQIEEMEKANNDVLPTVIVENIDIIAAVHQLNSADVLELVDEIRLKAHSIVLSLNSDSSLVGMRNPQTPIERHHHIILTCLAHDAHTILSVRPLQTGRSKDVSGVIRVVRGGTNDCSDDPELDMLYSILRDSSGVRLYPRGQDL